MSMSARVILDSIGPNDVRLTTFELTLPRIVLAEFNTHRMLSRNSASSRAIPFAKMVERCNADPFVPKRWPKNQKGMQATEYLDGRAEWDALHIWHHARTAALTAADDLGGKDGLDVHKAICNRLLEPFLWHTIVFTATELENFYALRADKMAQDEIREPTEMLIEAYEKSTPMKLNSGEWHLPFVTGYDINLGPEGRTWFVAMESGGRAQHERSEVGQAFWTTWCQISSARCARVSYLNHEGKRSLEDDEKMYGRLLQPGHMSPLEHAAKALTTDEWASLAARQCEAWMIDRVPVGNFYGWLQFRKTIEHEHNAKLLRAARN